MKESLSILVDDNYTVNEIPKYSYEIKENFGPLH